MGGLKVGSLALPILIATLWDGGQSIVGPGKCWIRFNLSGFYIITFIASFISTTFFARNWFESFQQALSVVIFHQQVDRLAAIGGQP